VRHVLCGPASVIRPPRCRYSSGSQRHKTLVVSYL